MRQGRARLTAGRRQPPGRRPLPRGLPAEPDRSRPAGPGRPGGRSGAAASILLVVTDGRDFADPKGEGPGDFAALGREIRKAGVTPLVVAFPPPDADRAQAAANLSDLHDAAGGVAAPARSAAGSREHARVAGAGDGRSAARARWRRRWSWRLFGGSHRLSVRLNVGGGQRLSADMGDGLDRPGQAALAAAGRAPACWRWSPAWCIVVMRRRGVGGPDEDDEILRPRTI